MNFIFTTLILLEVIACHKEEALPTKGRYIQRQEEYDPSDFRESPSNVKLIPGSSSEADASGPEMTD